MTSAPRGYEGKTGAGRAKARPKAVRDVESQPCPGRPGVHWLRNSSQQQYEDLPISLHRAKSGAPCAGRCGKRTSNPGGMCRPCRKAKP